MILKVEEVSPQGCWSSKSTTEQQETEAEGTRRTQGCLRLNPKEGHFPFPVQASDPSSKLHVCHKTGEKVGWRGVK